MDNINNDNNTPSKPAAEPKGKLKASIKDLYDRALQAKGKIDTAPWVQQMSEAWEATCQSGEVSSNDMWNFIMFLKVFALTNAGNQLKIGLKKNKVKEAENSLPTRQKKNAVDSFEKFAKCLHNQTKLLSVDQRAFTAGTILRIPEVCDFLRDQWKKMKDEFLPTNAPILYTKAMANVLTMAEYLDMWETRMRLFRIAMEAFESSELETRKAGVHEGRYYSTKHRALTSKGAKKFKLSKVELVETITSEKLKEWADDKKFVREHHRAFLVAGLLLNPKSALESSDFKQDRTDDELLQTASNAMGLVVHLAGEKVPEEFIQADKDESQHESMVLFWECFARLKDTRRAINSTFTTVGGPNTRKNYKLKPVKEYKGKSLF